METSLAPSPILSVTQFPLFLYMWTTSAFCFGLTLQQITLLELRLILKNASSSSGLPSIVVSTEPSTAITTFSCLKSLRSVISDTLIVFLRDDFLLVCLLCLFTKDLICLSFCLIMSRMDFESIASEGTGYSTAVKVSRSMILHDLAISIAVS